MAKYTEADCRLCRREGTKLFLKGERCLSKKCAMERRPSIPGQHPNTRKKPSEYQTQLREKQKVKRAYGLLEKQFHAYYVEAERISNSEIVKGALVTIAMAKAEGWFSKKDKYGNETSKWQTMPELMLAYRASAFFARVHIPESLMGVSIEGEVEDISKPDRVETAEPLNGIMAEAEEVFK